MVERDDDPNPPQSYELEEEDIVGIAERPHGHVPLSDEQKNAMEITGIPEIDAGFDDGHPNPAEVNEDHNWPGDTLLDYDRDHSENVDGEVSAV